MTYVNTRVSPEQILDANGNVKYRKGDTSITLDWGEHKQVANQDDHYPFPEWMLATSSQLVELAKEYTTNVQAVSTIRNYLTGTSGGCITAGYLSEVFVRTDTKIEHCDNAMFVQCGDITFQDIKEGTMNNNGGEYLFGYPSYVPGEIVRQGADTNGTYQRSWNNIRFIGDRSTVDGCYLTGSLFSAKAYVLTTHQTLSADYKPCRLNIIGKVKIDKNKNPSSSHSVVTQLRHQHLENSYCDSHSP